MATPSTSVSSDIRLPNNWDPRPYQMRAWTALEAGIKRALLLWHRRSGKDDISMHWTACAAMQRVGNYWHMLPKANQARKAMWDAVNPHSGKRRIDEAFPVELRDTTREQEMFIRFKNGSTWQVLGSDNYNQLVGSPPIGLVLSEYALSDPAAWNYLSPILVENGGWAIFPYTPRGKNHGHLLYKINQRNPDWFVERLTIEDTGIFTEADMERERREGKSEEFLQQEYYCSFEAPNEGAYYGRMMAKAWSQKRITKVPVEPSIDCETYWDLGMDDSTSIWIMQSVGRELHFVQYYENSGESLGHYINWLKDWAEQHEVRFSRHGMPHDIEVRELATGKSRREIAMSLGLKPITVAKQLPVSDGIEAVRKVLHRCFFDEVNCGPGISALTEYAKDYDEKNRVYRNNPRHDWSSHGADAFRTFAVVHRDFTPVVSRLEVQPVGGQIIHERGPSVFDRR